LRHARERAENNTTDDTLPIPAGLDSSGNGVILKVHVRRAFLKKFRGAVAPIALLALSGLSAAAQPAPGFPQGLDPLFQGMLARPTDLNNTLQYAAMAPAGDIESAISTYEQLLFYNPTLARVRFELGVLYYRLGSYEMARGYFQSAQQMRDITPELRQQSEDLIAAIDKKLQPDQLSGFAQTGLRYQTNAASGPGPQAILASRTFNSRFFAQGDGNWFGAFGVNYVHDFENQNGDTFEASLLGYDAQQFKLHQFDIGLLEFRAGPRFGLTPDSAGGLSLKPYVVATGALLADAPYYSGIGGGLTAHAHIGEIALDPYAEVVQQNFHNSTFYPLATGLNGTLATYALPISAPIYSGLTWQSRFAFAQANAAFNPYGYNAYVGDIWLPWNFSFPGDGRTWTLTPSVGVTYWVYNAPDPTINPTVTPRTLEWRVGLGLDVPIWKMLYLGMLVQYRADQSNLAVFSMHDLSVTAGPSIKF
jgi:hypothetical protein